MFFATADEKWIRVEKEKARTLRKSRWWQNKIAASPPCYYCQQVLQKDAVTMDHIVPIARGGKSTPGNIVVCCKTCNNEKKYMTASEWSEVERSRKQTNSYLSCPTEM